MKLSTLLCFDFGSKRIGVAVGQTVTGTATPLLTLAAHNYKPDWGVIAGLIADWRPDALIVGVPLTLHGGSQEMTGAAARFARQLQGRFHLPVYGMDERFSTLEARERAAGASDREIDAIAAQTILESWMRDHDPQQYPGCGNDCDRSKQHAGP